MKTTEIKLTALSLIFVMVSLLSFSGISAGNSGLNASGSAYFEEYFDYEALNKLLETQLKPELNVKIFDSSNQLVAAGNDNEDKIQGMIPVADLLIEIDGTKYYRLSY
jgi:hypothetical protein